MRTRFCARPPYANLHAGSTSNASRAGASASLTRSPDLVYMGKGLHDACRSAAANESAFEAEATRKLHALAAALRCLPPTTVVLLVCHGVAQTHDHSSAVS